MSISNKVYHCKVCNIILETENKMKGRRICCPCYKNRCSIYNHTNRERINSRIKFLYKERKDLERQNRYRENN